MSRLWISESTSIDLVGEEHIGGSGDIRELLPVLTMLWLAQRAKDPPGKK